MIQRLGTGKKLSHWPYDMPKCHFCRATIKKGEEWVGYGDDSTRRMHRVCLENWLHDHPPKANGKTPSKIVSAEEAEKEFKKIRARLLRQQKARSKTSS